MKAEKKSVWRGLVLCKGIRWTGISMAAVIMACLGTDMYALLFFIQEYRRSNAYWGAIPTQMILLSAAVLIVTAGGFLFVWWVPRRRERMRIAELTDYLEQINVGAAGALLMKKEDEFSHLQDEMYKTVTELYHTREQAVAAKENYADNLANIAHQLKTPVTAASLSLQLLKNQVSKGMGAMERERVHGETDIHAGDALKDRMLIHIRQIKKQLGRLEHLEEALLTLSQIDAGTLRLECAQVDIYTVLNLAADNLDSLLSQKNISVDIPDKGSVTFLGDMEWTMEAVMNLMKNCMEHAPTGSTIHCDYSANPLYREICIWDEGAGFAKEDMLHLFERFYRGENPTVAVENQGNDTGVGIGLSLARDILKLQNGTITARNLPQGGGCFEIKIYSH